MTTMTMPQTKPATEKQLGFLNKLMAERPSYVEAKSLDTYGLTTKTASTMIDELLKQPKESAKKTEVKPSGYTPKRGDVHVIDGRYLRVSVGQHSGRPYCTEWTGAEWVIAKGMIFKVSAATVATVEQVSAFGHAYERCVFCTLPLDVAESITRGYGKVCAGKHGLPWGTSTVTTLSLLRSELRSDCE